jgi:hypothetical protein
LASELRRRRRLRRQLRALEIQFTAELQGSAAGKFGKATLQPFHGRHRAGQGLVDRHATPQRREQLTQRLAAKGFDHVLDDQRGLVVGELQVFGAGGTEERGTQLGDRSELASQDHRAITGRHRLSPPWIALTFLVDRDPFAQPARHAVVGFGQRDDVAKLVPQHTLPIRRPRSLRGGTVGGDQRAEAHAQVTFTARHPEGADGEVALLGEDLNHHRLVKLQGVLLAEHAFGFGQQLGHRGAVDLPLAGIHADQDFAATATGT